MIFFMQMLALMALFLQNVMNCALSSLNKDLR